MSKMAISQLQAGDSVETAIAETLAVFAYQKDIFRMTVIDRDGVVLFDSASDPERMDNHLFRPEIAAAFRTRSIGDAIRTSDTIEQEMLYLAIYEPERDLVVRSSMPLNAHQATVNQLLTSLLLVLAAVVIVLIIIGVFSLRRLARPLIRLRKAAESMREGDLSVRVDLEKGDPASEMSVLTQTFNDMTERIHENIKDLSEKNARLDAMLDAMADPVLAVDDRFVVTFMNAHAKSVFGRCTNALQAVFPLILITHSHETEAVVAQAMETGETITDEMTLDTEFGKRAFQVTASPVGTVQADGAIITFHDISQVKRAQEMRSEFVANVTHELRTPLTSIRGFIETLRNGAIHNADVSERFLDIIDIEAERLHQLINDILVLSEIEVNQKEWDYDTFDLHELLSEVVVLLCDQASERRVAVHLPEDQAPFVVSASRDRIKQLMINLVDNAIKYNHVGGAIFIDIQRLEDGKVAIAVRDTGPGIEPEYQERIFERFYRVDKSRSRALGGTGLGLSIVKHIAQLYRGQASVESSPGEGSTFHVTLEI